MDPVQQLINELKRLRDRAERTSEHSVHPQRRRGAFGEYLAYCKALKAVRKVRNELLTVDERRKQVESLLPFPDSLLDPPELFRHAETSQ